MSDADDWITPAESHSGADDWVSPDAPSHGETSTAPPTPLQSFLNNPAVRLAHDTVISPAAGLVGDVLKAGKTITSLAGTAPNAVSDSLGTAANYLESGVEKPFSDARAAAHNTPGYAAARAAADADASHSSLGLADQVTAPVLPGLDSTVAYLGQAAGNLGREISGKPVTTTAADAANAQADATSGALEDYQKEHPILSTAAALAPAAVTMGTASAPSVSRFFGKGARNSIDALTAMTDGLRKQASAAYGVVNRSGMQVAPSALNDLLNSIYTTNVNGARIVKPTLNTTLYPKAASVLGELQTAARTQAPLSMTDLSEFRQMASDAAADYSAAPADRMRAHLIKNNIDGFVQKLDPSQMYHPAGMVDNAAVSALSTARDLWSRQAQADELLRIMRKAKNDAGVNFTQSGYEQALRRRFKNLLNHDVDSNALSPDVRKGVQSVVDGGSADNFLRNTIAKFAPHGFLPLAGSAGAIGAAYETGGLPAAMGAVGIPAAGELARQYATRATLGRATGAVETALAGSNANIPAVTRAQATLQRLAKPTTGTAFSWPAYWQQQQNQPNP